MSVIMESQVGDKIFIIEEFTGSEHHKAFSWDDCRDFNIGDEVYYLDFLEDKNDPGKYDSWSILYKTKDGKVYSAIQQFFVTESVWNNLKDYFNNL
ncbi:hypothetical protein [Bacillus cihuensis]|uniref:hypothetical protein n=1 Tax=Bacillus cihuensis TaxID=1208599 RepID=UPI0003FCEFD3|nr:hypothetical protein [Bacillus cihuensis]